MRKGLPVTACRHPRFIESVRLAMRKCAIRAIACGLENPMAEVVNRKGEVVAFCWFHKRPADGRPAFEIFDRADRDITDNVRQAFALASA